MLASGWFQGIVRGAASPVATAFSVSLNLIDDDVARIAGPQIAPSFALAKDLRL